MFKRIVIELSEPICKCPEQNLAWCPSKDKKGLYALLITCEACDTKLMVGNDHFVAAFRLDEPYPGKPPGQPYRDPPKKEVNGDLIKVDFGKEKS